MVMVNKLLVVIIITATIVILMVIILLVKTKTGNNDNIMHESLLNIDNILNINNSKLSMKNIQHNIVIGHRIEQCSE